MSANRDYSAHSAVLSTDFITMLDSHPDSFDCLFYSARLDTAENVAAAAGAVDVVGSIEGSHRKIDYADPVPSRARIVHDEGLSLLAYEAGEGMDLASGSEPVVILLKEGNVPKQSVISWLEKTGPAETDTKTVYYYVLESRPFGRAPVAGMKHYCIPFLNEGEL
jgi:hypothetical protein